MHAETIAGGTAPTTVGAGPAETELFHEPPPAIQPEAQYAAIA